MIPASGGDCIATPTPQSSPCLERRGGRNGDSMKSQADSHSNGGGSNNNNSSVAYVPRRLRGSDLSLTTITEEPPSWTSSHEIVVQPEVVVETATCNGNGSCSSSSSGSECSTPPLTSSSSSSMHGRQHFTTKVTATAKVKVEVHAPMHSSVEPSYYKHRRRRDGQ